MKKLLCLLFALFLVALCGCDQPAADVDGTVDSVKTHGNKNTITEESVKDIAYKCSICNGDCSFFTGRFSYPVLNGSSADAEQINAEIKEEFDKYYAMATAAKNTDSGLAYGYTYNVYTDKSFAVIRTNVATVMLHSGGSYSYSVYYYDIKNDKRSDVVALCKDLGLDLEVLASYVRLQLAEDENYSAEQIAMVDAQTIDVFPLEDGYFIKCKTDMVKYEAELKSADLNKLGPQIEEERSNFAEEMASREAQAAELASVVASEWAEESRLAAEEASREAEYENYYGYGGYYGW